MVSTIFTALGHDFCSLTVRLISKLVFEMTMAASCGVVVGMNGAAVFANQHKG